MALVVIPRLTWSRCGGMDCLRVGDLVMDARVEVRPQPSLPVPGLPAMAGRIVRDGADICFVPRFAFVAGTTYEVLIDGAVAAALQRPRATPSRPQQVVAIHPSAAEVPRNLLRLYVQFSMPMAEGHVSSGVRLEDEAGQVLAGALLAGDELWDPEHRRLTLLLDPARIKRGLLPHREVGYPLRAGMTIQVVISPGFLDARGAPLRLEARRLYRVGDDERRHVDPRLWTLRVPPAGSIAPLAVWFDRPLDHGLLRRCLTVLDDDGRRLDGVATVGPEERSWTFLPRAPAAAAGYQLAADAFLEDLAGNSLSRVFDRELAKAEDNPRDLQITTVSFEVR